MIVGIDLGSNTLRAIEYNPETKQFEGEYEKMVKTADKMVQTGVISDEAQQRVIGALKEAQTVLDFTKATVVAKTTAAMRMAKNKAKVLERIQKETGVLFDLIEASEEAYYTQLAVINRMKLLGMKAKESFLLDIGGGSTELIFINQEGYVSKSIDVGIVTMAQSFTSKEALQVALEKKFTPLVAFKNKQCFDENVALISTAGTPTTIASMKHGFTVKTYDAKVINGTVLTKKDIEEQVERLLSMNDVDRTLHVGVGRDELIIVGVEMLLMLLKVLSFENTTIIDDGMREGIALDSAK